jgi:hypothetical protein
MSCQLNDQNLQFNPILKMFWARALQLDSIFVAQSYALSLVMCIHSFPMFTPWQIINVYNQEYESGAAFWPDVHGRVITALVISQLALLGLMSTKEAAQSAPFLIALPVLTIWFHRFCNGRHKSAFVKYPLQVCWCLHILEFTLFILC